ncbi:MAG: helix-turn-helix transcriptional regulator [Marivibrio sp.]|uniref:helix-turn-helix domain-containing protein n=1 Tax=Marivibrio sp. TaxID=2039719 RepID=UPI0032EE31F0
MEDHHFPRNLALLCSYYSSIAEVCRKLDVNRQQFNKYLNGQSRPSRHNMRRVCDFFGVTESEMLLEPGRFQELVALRRRPMEAAVGADPLRHLEILYQRSSPLDRYVGYYFRYFYSFGYAGQIIKSLGVIYEKDGRYYWKNFEMMRRRTTGARTTVSKYMGAVLMISERIYVLEYEALLQKSITQMTLYPSYHTRVDQMLGVQTGGPVRRGRRPGASRVLLEYLGRRVDVRKALAQADIYPPEDPQIPPGVRRLIENEIPAGAYVLEAEEP